MTAVVKDGTGDGRDGRVLPFELHKEAMDSYMAYALSVLLGRALPDVRDGLKPVHRRILSSVSFILMGIMQYMIPWCGWHRIFH